MRPDKKSTTDTAAESLLAEGAVHVETLRANPNAIDAYPYSFLLLIARGGASTPNEIFWGVATLEAKGWTAESWDMAPAGLKFGAWRVVMRRRPTGL
ncbi:hypothetical protein [Streptomyces sp. NBC_00503]|uniref:hypothetical protein n=1 Tax=Streptomyces sp. NBC_00503 TaxID=2903659 RepID=UPI002E81E9C9|nr:hypothetical protein [Streptomyces sp. NBC_00503]WUD81040.1 hypothetical protein OG490_11050 [Streptomyces sp. NBC_00503]